MRPISQAEELWRLLCSLTRPVRGKDGFMDFPRDPITEGGPTETYMRLCETWFREAADEMAAKRKALVVKKDMAA